jgi:hypothetical protein
MMPGGYLEVALYEAYVGTVTVDGPRGSGKWVDRQPSATTIVAKGTSNVTAHHMI